MLNMLHLGLKKGSEIKMCIWLPMGTGQIGNKNGNFILTFHVFEPCARITYFKKLDASGSEEL